MDSAGAFGAIGAAMRADAKLGSRVGGVIQFVLSSPESTWLIDCKGGTVEQRSGKADCTITMTDADFVALATGKLNGVIPARPSARA